MAFWENKNTYGYTPAIFHSPFFVWAVGILVFVCWVTNAWIFGIISIAVLAGLILALCKDTTPCLSLLWMFLFVISHDRHHLNDFTQLLWAVLALVIGMIIHMVRFRPNLLEVIKPKRIKASTIAMFVMAACIIFGGLLEKDRSAIPVLAITAIALLVCLFYVFFYATTDRGVDGKRLVRYLLLVMFVSACVITLQVLVRYIELGDFQTIVEYSNAKRMNLGWGATNNYSIILGMCVPASCYYAYKYPKASPIFAVLFVLFMVIIGMSNSRGAMLFGGSIAPLCVLYVIIKAKKGTHRNTLLVVIISFAIILGILLVVFWDEAISLIERSLKAGAKDNGRLPLYKLAVENFLHSPLFGRGFDYNLGGMAGDGYSPFWYHCTVFQILSCMGIVGCIGMAYLYFIRYRLYFYRNATSKEFLSVDVTMLLAGMLIFDGYGLLDVFFFTPNGIIFLAIIQFVVAKSLTPEQDRPFYIIFDDKLKQKRLKRTADLT